jgi:hypothetical protein
MKLKEKWKGLKGLKGKKRLALLLCTAVLGVAVLGAGGYGVWWVATVPKGAVNLSSLTKKDIASLYRQKNKRKNDVPPRLEILLGPLEDARLTANGNDFNTVPIPETLQPLVDNGASQFSDREWLLTEQETYEGMQTEQETEIMRGMQVRALIKLALTKNCERVQFSVEYINLPQGEITTLEEYLAANGGAGSAAGEGGYTFVFSADWASRTIGRDIKTVAANRETFNAFMLEMENYEPVEALVVPGAGRG